MRYALEQRRFNLIDEPWIPCLLLAGDTVELSLRDVFTRWDHIHSLAGELATVDVAITRLLLAVMYRALPERSINAWQPLRTGADTGTRIDTYLTDQHDRFWLFDPEQPFYQTAIAATDRTDIRATRQSWVENPVTRLLPEHEVNMGNRRILSSRLPLDVTSLGFAEAARWLVTAQAFDKVSKTSPHAQTQPGVRQYPKPAPTTRGSVVMAAEPNLRETLFANFILSPDLTTSGPDDLPAWERDHDGGLDSDLDFTDKALNASVMAEDVSSRKVTGVVDALTWQSRRFSLVTEDDRVIAVVRAPGDVMGRQDAYEFEPMVGWREKPGGKRVTLTVPAAHSAWKEAGAFLTTREGEGVKPAPVVLWGQRLAAATNAGSGTFRVVTIHWADQKARYRELADHNLTIGHNLLGNAGLVRPVIEAAIADAVRLVDEIRQAITKTGGPDGGHGTDLMARVATIWPDFLTRVATGTGGRSRRSRDTISYEALRPDWVADVLEQLRPVAETHFDRAGETRFLPSRTRPALSEVETWMRRNVAAITSGSGVVYEHPHHESGPVVSWRRHVTRIPEHIADKPFSLALGELTERRGTSVQRRARSLADADNPDAIRVHLRALVVLMCNAGIGFDHDTLGRDLHSISAGAGQQVLRAWARDGFAHSNRSKPRPVGT
ncbi:type I-E CRISPR-associated protein Cse1/CasA [Aeromicrobium sp. 179-A 4D2 NHS]|uniref:type I-E CRISPR-associated protein Cse1/CasA n=1 Tax=Aeromicrobium sp. 179-A 4D2 NHS TaxID=3142375 RepID=UPI0039A0C83A